MYLYKAAGEGFEEFVTEYADAVANKVIIAQDERGLGEISKDAVRAAALGSITSGVLQGVEIGGQMTKEKLSALADNLATETVNNLETEQAAQTSAGATQAENQATTPTDTVQADTALLNTRDEAQTQTEAEAQPTAAEAGDKFVPSSSQVDESYHPVDESYPAVDATAPAEAAPKTAADFYAERKGETEQAQTTTQKKTPDIWNAKRDGKYGWGKTYGTAMEALWDNMPELAPTLYKAYEEEINSGAAYTPILSSVIAIGEDVRQEQISIGQALTYLEGVYRESGLDGIKGTYNRATGNVYSDILEQVKDVRHPARFSAIFSNVAEKLKKARSKEDRAATMASLSFGERVFAIENELVSQEDAPKIEVREDTPRVLIEKAGFDDLPIYMNYDTAYLSAKKFGYMKGDYHDLGAEIMDQIPEAMKDPVVLVRLPNGRANEVLSIKDKKGRNILVSVELHAEKTGRDGQDHYSLVITAFGASKRYINNVINNKENTVIINKMPADVSQVTTQRHNRLGGINDVSTGNNEGVPSADTVPQSVPTVKGQTGKNYGAAGAVMRLVKGDVEERLEASREVKRMSQEEAEQAIRDMREAGVESNAERLVFGWLIDFSAANLVYDEGLKSKSLDGKGAFILSDYRAMLDKAGENLDALYTDTSVGAAQPMRGEQVKTQNVAETSPLLSEEGRQAAQDSTPTHERKSWALAKARAESYIARDADGNWVNLQDVMDDLASAVENGEQFTAEMEKLSSMVLLELEKDARETGDWTAFKQYNESVYGKSATNSAQALNARAEMADTATGTVLDAAEILDGAKQSKDSRKAKAKTNKTAEGIEKIVASQVNEAAEKARKVVDF